MQNSREARSLLIVLGARAAAEDSIDDGISTARPHTSGELLTTLSLALIEAEDLESALVLALRNIGELTGWEAGEVWMPSSDGGELTCRAVWTADPSRHDPGAALPDRIRIPILSRGAPVAMFEFLTDEVLERDQEMVELVSAAAAQLGAFVLRRKAEEDQRRAEQELRAALREKDALLREVHHRVRNSLQLVSSLLGAHARTLEGGPARDVLRESQNRVRSIALVHEKLYQRSDVSELDLGRYLGELCAQLTSMLRAKERELDLVLDLAPLPVDVDTAVSCGLIVHEMVANALEHAFVGRVKGRVEVSLRHADHGLVAISVRDDGVGLPDDFTKLRGRTLGLELIEMLTGELRGRLEIEAAAPGGGARITVRFPQRKGTR